MNRLSVLLVVGSMALAACQAGTTVIQPGGASLKVLAVETFLADIAQNVAGERVKVETLMPPGVDPHAFEPAPADVAKIASCDVLIANGAGLEGWLNKVLDNARGTHVVIEASAGLTSRSAREGEAVSSSPQDQGDPHFWMDPLSVITYVENIREGLAKADPGGKEVYSANADAYIARLKDLDAWIKEQVKTVPEERRLLVTNHESFGYFADRYGFKITGTIIPSVSSEASPSAQQLARLVDQIRATHATAIFLETGSNPRLAEQVAQETGIKVVTEMYLETLSAPGGKAPTYIDMLKYDTQTIVEVLK